MDKGELRRCVRERKRGFTEEQLERMSIPIIRRLLSNPAVVNAQTVLIYCSLPDEVDTRSALIRLKEMGKTVLLPRVLDDENMEIAVYESADCMTKGLFGISESTGKRFTNYDEIDVAIIPGMGFDARFNRLGRGKGYYDRLLLKMPKTYKIGVCFDFQKFDSIPSESQDVPMDEVI